MIRGAMELLVALERECLDADKAIAKRRWDLCEVSWTNQRRLTHELDISLHEQPPATPEESALIKKRIDRLTKYRDGQLKRLRSFNDAVATRLATMGKFKSFSKNIDKERRSSLVDVTT
jgi:hypothetical protein